MLLAEQVFIKVGDWSANSPVEHLEKCCLQNRYRSGVALVNKFSNGTQFDQWWGFVSDFSNETHGDMFAEELKIRGGDWSVSFPMKHLETCCLQKRYRSGVGIG